MAVGRGHVGSRPLRIADLLDNRRKLGIVIKHEIHYKPILVKPPVRQANAETPPGRARGAITGDNKLCVNGIEVRDL